MYQGYRRLLRGAIAVLIIAGLSWAFVGCSARQVRQDVGARYKDETSTPRADTFEAQVVHVTDGDTIKVLYQGERLTLRLARIDAPERAQAYGAEATQFLRVQTLNKVVIVQTSEKDRYGRWLAEVYLQNGQNMNELLVAHGLAWWYRKYAPKDFAIRDLEAQAREAKVGLWSEPNPIPPWRFRRKH